jgi:ankyrin repeat protein
MLQEITDGTENYNLLHYATKAFRLKLIMYLVDDADFDVNSLTKSGMNVVHLLVINTVDEQSRSEDEKKSLCEEIFKYFMKKKAKINAQDEKGNTPLHYAVTKQHKPTTMILVYANGINLNVNIFCYFLHDLSRS